MAIEYAVLEGDHHQSPDGHNGSPMIADWDDVQLTSLSFSGGDIQDRTKMGKISTHGSSGLTVLLRKWTIPLLRRPTSVQKRRGLSEGCHTLHKQ